MEIQKGSPLDLLNTRFSLGDAILWGLVWLFALVVGLSIVFILCLPFVAFYYFVLGDKKRAWDRGPKALMVALGLGFAVVLAIAIHYDARLTKMNTKAVAIEEAGRQTLFRLSGESLTYAGWEYDKIKKAYEDDPGTSLADRERALRRYEQDMTALVNKYKNNGGGK